MADSQVSGLVEQVKVGNTTHNLASTAYGICDTAAGTAEKTVNMTGFYLTKGVTVHIKFTNANSAASPTLNINETGAMPIVQYGTTAVGKSSSTSGWYAGAVVSFTYDGTSWVRDQGYNTNDNTIPSYLYHYNNIKARQAIAAESLIVGDSTGYEKVASGVTFDLAYPIVWCTAAVSANSSNYANMFLQHYDRNIATGAKSGFTSSANKVIYLIVTISGNIATIDSNIITDTLPSTEDGKVYISLGKLGAQSTGANYFFLYPTHPMFWYKDGAIRVYADDIYVKKSGDTMTGNLTLNAASGDSPSILFTRNGSLTDWKIVDTGGKLSFQSGTDASTWTERGYFKDNSGDFVATSFTGNGSALTNLNASNLSSGTVPVARLPLATTDAAGVVKIGSGISVNDGTISVSAANLGLSSALRYQGTTTTVMSDGLTTAAVTIGGNSYTPTQGDVVIYDDAEYLWTGSLWELIGAESSFKKVQTAVSTSTASGSSATTFVSSVTQDTQGVITVKTSTLDTSGTWSGTASKATTAADTSSTLYIVGVASGATSTLKHDTSVTVKGGAVSATTYNALTLTASTTGFTIAGGSTTSKTLTVNENVTLKAGSSTYLAYYNGNNVLQGHTLAHFSDEFGSSVKDKKNELVLGNGTGKTSNGSSWGQLALYSSGTKGTYLKTEENSTDWYTATLPAKTGTIAYTSDVTASRVEIIRLTS